MRSNSSSKASQPSGPRVNLDVAQPLPPGLCEQLHACSLSATKVSSSGRSPIINEPTLERLSWHVYLSVSLAGLTPLEDVTIWPQGRGFRWSFDSSSVWNLKEKRGKEKFAFFFSLIKQVNSGLGLINSLDQKPFISWTFYIILWMGRNKRTRDRDGSDH